MKWSEQKPPIKGICWYDHVTCETPLGQASIEWKSWKDFPSYSVMLNGNYLGEKDSLEDAKKFTREHLLKVYCELRTLLDINP